MEKKELSTHNIFTIVHGSLAIVTLIPVGFVSKASPLGYKALCSFSPYSTLILLAMAGLHIYLHLRSGKKNI